jgi:hypothetical protein
MADRSFHTYFGYWTGKTKKAYEAFMKAAFAPYQGVATDAKIQSSSFQKRAAFLRRNVEWKPSWDEAFTGQKDSQIRELYLALTIAFLDDLEANSVLTMQEH